MTARLRSLDELLVKGTSKGNPRSSSGSHRLSVEVESTTVSSSLMGETSSSGKVMLKKRSRAHEELVQEVVAKGTVFLGAPARSDI